MDELLQQVLTDIGVVPSDARRLSKAVMRSHDPHVMAFVFSLSRATVDLQKMQLRALRGQN